MREEVKAETRNRHTYSIIRTDEEEWMRGSGFEYEFVLFIDGESTMTASALEQDGWEKPWADALRRYAEAYIDGLSAGGQP